MDNIHINDQNSLTLKIAKIKQDGINHLHIISDFDRTLTKSTVNGQKTHFTYQLIRNSGLLDQQYTNKGNALFEKYYPYEISQEISEEERNLKMQQWWDAHYTLMQEYGITQQIIDTISKNQEMQLRDGCDKFLFLLCQHQISLLIFSAGLGNVIDNFLAHQNLLTSNVHIISNYFQFDQSGNVTGIQKPFIHVHNKKEYAIQNTPYYKEIQHKKNVILLGDSLGDLGMTEGIEHATILKIGFLNHSKETTLQQYLANFDIVITDDGNFEYINTLLQKII
jgi:cytosolic 5'-nucleotidase 3